MELMSNNLPEIWKYFLIVSHFVMTSYAGNILMLFQEPATSHFHDAAIVAETLKSRGHNITFLLPADPTDETSALGRGENFTIMQLDRNCVFGDEKIDVVKLLQETTIKSGTFSIGMIRTFMDVLRGVAQDHTIEVEANLCDSWVTDRLTNAKFDIVLMEGSFIWLYGLVQKLGLPYATLTTCAASSITNAWNHAPNLPAVLPGFMVKRHHRRSMPFSWRVLNAVNIFTTHLLFYPVIDWVMLAAASDYASVHALVPPTKGFGLTNLWLTNADFSTDVPRPFLPNTVNVGGLSVLESRTLTKEFQDIVDNATEHGVLVVSMGTVVHGLSQEQLDTMAYAFSKLKQTVVWKTPVPSPRFIGNNTILRRWIPQNDLLAHPSVRAMVYHCGNNGAFEALYHGIPIIGIPVFGDQTDVAYRIMSNGMGLVVEVADMTNDTLYSAVSEVINNQRYRDRARYLSRVYRDNPAPAHERAAYWVEYVLRHRGNRLMRAKVAEIDRIQEYLLDVWAFIITSSLIASVVIRRLATKLLRRSK